MKPCAHCGTELLQFGTTFIHAGNDCILAQIRIEPDQIEKWERRAVVDTVYAEGLLPVGTLAWALIAPNGNIRFWSRNRSSVTGMHAKAPACTLSPIIGAAPATAGGSDGDQDC